MRHFVIASHAHFATGIRESISLLTGDREDITDLSMFVDGRDDIAAEVSALVAKIPAEDELVICTDLFGGSVNNEFTKALQTRPDTYLITNMNLPLLIQLLYADYSAPTEQVIRQIVEAEDTRVKFVNDLVGSAGEDEEF